MQHWGPPVKGSARDGEVAEGLRRARIYWIRTSQGGPHQRHMVLTFSHS